MPLIPDKPGLGAMMASLFGYYFSTLQCAPDEAVGVDVVCGNLKTWDYGAFSTIRSAGSTPYPYVLRNLIIEACSASAIYQVKLSIEGGIEIAAARFSGPCVISLSSPIIAAGVKLRAKVCSSSGNADTVRMSIMFLEFSAGLP